MCESRISRRKLRISGKRPLYYYITDRTRLRGMSLIACVRKALDRGVDFIQIREKDLEARALFDLTRRVVVEARGTQCRVLVNGRADVALAAGAHGVHLPSTGLRISDVRKWCPRNFLIGLSVHTIPEIRRACAQRPDYMLLGHVFPTGSKLGYGRPLGLEHLKKACSITKIPILGLGGIKPELVESVLKAGAAGIAGIGLFQD